MSLLRFLRRRQQKRVLVTVKFPERVELRFELDVCEVHIENNLSAIDSPLGLLDILNGRKVTISGRTANTVHAHVFNDGEPQ